MAHSWPLSGDCYPVFTDTVVLARELTPDGILELQHALHGAAEHALEIDTRAYELEPPTRISQELVPHIHAAVDEALGVLSRLLDRYDSPANAKTPDESGMFDVLFEEIVEPANQPPKAWQRVADVSFMARWELDRKQRAIAVAERADGDRALLSECCSIRRRVVRATSGVEQVLAEVEGCPSVFEGFYRTERQCAVETRAAYLSFASGLRGVDDEHVPVVRGLRLAGISIARLIGRDIYQDLWVDDRLQIRELQRRLLDWLRHCGEPLEGRRLIGDVQAFAALLMQVNRRSVLMEHDQNVLHQFRMALRQPLVDETTWSSVLSSVRGRERQLDQLIDARTPLVPHLWEATVERVLEDLTLREDSRARGHGTSLEAQHGLGAGAT